MENYQQDKSYIKNLWLKYKEWKAKTRTNDRFYSVWLSSLFFGAFNKKSDFISKELPDEIQESFRIMPYLNGGLFYKTELDEIRFDVPDEVFEWLFESDNKDIRKGFLEIYNFTIDESTLLDVEVAVDPEMIGRVYESLINEEERGEAGIFYTPRVEIDLMCRLSLVNYLKSKTNLPEEKLIDFIFNPQEGVNVFSENELRDIKNFLDDVKILDPAVGSASFLVGMMNVLVQLHSEISRKLENKEENLFALKEKIILDNLYGVDVKDWAVMVGELRLWLSLIVETDEKYMDIYTKPLLPNLSFKIRQGDSLIQEIADIPIDFRNEMLNLPRNTRDKINELIDRKFKFFSGMRSADLKEIKEVEQFEKEIFKEIISDEIAEKQNKIKSIEQNIKIIEGQKDLWGKKSQKTGSEIENLQRQIENLKKDIKRYQDTLSAVESNKAKDFFLWEIDFIEVFPLKGGFDIIIGNPPYVRQEMIAPPLLNKNDYDDDKWREIKREYKEKLVQKVKTLWENSVNVDRKSDLYVYFYYQSLSLLRPGGIFCFINSNSWLDVGYGAGLQEFLLKNMEPLMIVDNLKKRSFRQADVNTVIVLIKRPENKPEDFTLKFVAFKKPFEDVMKPDVFKRIAKASKPIFDDEDFRIFPKTKEELLLEGVEIDEEEKELYKNVEFRKYIGNKWGGKYLRAPEIYFKILEKGKDKLVRLGDIAEVRRGFTTGANEFFYLRPMGITVKEVVEISEKDPYALIPVRNGVGWQGEIEAKFLKPVIKSPRELKTIIVKLEDLNHLVFMCHEEKSKLTGTNALKYIEWGEKQGYQKRPTCKGRERWWDLPKLQPSTIIFPYIVGENLHKFLSLQNIYNSDDMHCIYSSKNESYSLWWYLNSPIAYLQFEIISRSMVGIYKLQTYELKNVYVYKNDILINLNSLVKDYFNRMIDEIKKVSIFTELGFDPSKTIREQEPNPLPDRKALDDIVFDALGLTEEERKEVYWAVAELVKNRLEKARSV